MKRQALFTLLFFLSNSPVSARPTFQTFDKAGFYSAMASGRLEEINARTVGGRSVDGERKGSLRRSPAHEESGVACAAKREAGHLQIGLCQDGELDGQGTAGNIEYHFLRLMIQEHAPKVVHYDKDQVKDSQEYHPVLPCLIAGTAKGHPGLLSAFQTATRKGLEWVKKCWPSTIPSRGSWRRSSGS
jgi:hypothetical protein